MLNKKNYIIPQNIAIKYYFLSENCHNYLYRFFIREQFCKIMALRFLSFMGKLFAGCCPDNDIPTRRDKSGSFLPGIEIPGCRIRSANFSLLTRILVKFLSNDVRSTN